MRRQFQKVISIMLAAILAISMGQFGQIAIASETEKDNIVLYQSFEDGDVGGWKPVWDRPGTVAVSSDYASHGEKSLLFTDRTSTEHSPSLDITSYMEPGKIYDISLKVRLGEGSDEAHIASKVNSPLLDNIYPWLTGNVTISSDKWTTLEVKAYEVPDKTSEFVIYIETLNSTADIYIDEVLIVDVTPVAEPVTVLYQSFEDGDVGGWKPVWDRPGTVAISSDYASHGEKSLLFTDRTSTEHSPSLDITSYMEPGKIYDISLKVRLGEGSDEAHIASKVNSPLLDNIYPWLTGNVTISSDKWTTLEVKAYEVPDKTSEFIIYIETLNSTADIYIDEVLIVCISSGTTPGGDLDQSGIKSDFEDGIGNWMIRFEESGSIELTDDDNHTPGGAKSLAASVSSQYNGPILNVMGKMHKGHKYYLSAWVKMAPGQKPTVLRMSVQSGSSAFTNVSENVLVTENEWVQLTGTFTVAVTPSVLNAYIETADTPDETVTFYMDDFELSYIGPVATKPVQTDLTPIKEAYKDYFLIGSAVNITDFEGDRLKLLKHHFNVVTTENAMKPEFAYDKDKKFDFEEENVLVSKIEQEGLQLVGHVLVWHSQMPTWLSTAEDGKPLDRETAYKNLETHIKTVIENYGDKVISWDVVNEAIRDGLTFTATTENWKDALRDTPWLRALGPDYVEESFKIARKVLEDNGWTNVKLYYNDYNEDNQQKAAAIYSMVKDINERYAKQNGGKILIDGIGMQSHYNSSTNPENVRLTLEKFSSLEGVEISITELDITAGINSVLTDEQAKAQGYLYAQLFKLYKQYADKIARVTFWGLNDSTSWRKEGSPLLFDEYLQAKPAYYAIIDPDKFIKENPPPEKVVKQAKALYGTPVIDGEVDSIWYNTYNIKIDQYQQEFEGATGVAKALWDEENLYVLIQVQDDALDDKNANAWEQDSVEIFVDQNNAKTPYYEEEGDGQYRVNFNNVATFNPDSIKEGFESATSVTGTNYIVEVKIPLKTITPAKGTKIGFDLQINDAENGKRVSAAAWNDTTGTAYMDTSVFGELTLDKATGSGTGGSKGSGGGSSNVPETTETGSGNETTNNTGIITVEATVDENGNYTAVVDEKLVENVKDEKIKIEVKGAEQANNVIVKVAYDLISAASGANAKVIEVNTGLANIELPVSLFSGSKEGEEVELQVNKVDNSRLPEKVRTRVGQNTVFEFSLSVGGQKLSTFDETQKVKVSYPYTLEAGVRPSRVVVYYINENGEFEVIKNGRYSNGAIHFKTKHFSKYVAVPVEVNLKDIYETTWATDSIEALAAREIVKGVSADSFLPMKEVTRAEFVQMIVETFDLKSEAVINPFSDVVEGEWYEKAVLTAYELGIVKGKPDGTFGVNEKITRQDMVVITYSALKVSGININTTTKAVIFKDDTLISEYAKEAVAAMQRAGIINGMPGNLFAPKDTANRAQAAVILNKLLDEL
ncbi:endo-1,4-beta-xylanase [Acetivibrio clariflavus]|uniref:endo-1,4-beta-xylanase n=1 Tax=Acetivibrio clariflavus TaxID=288965 RepID=UPI0031F4B641